MLQERIDYFTYIFDLLQSTNSRNEKEQIVKDIDAKYKDDFNYIIECLAGKHKFGYKYEPLWVVSTFSVEDTGWTVRQLLEFLQEPMRQKDLSRENIRKYVAPTVKYSDFLESIVNRTLRLGIGNSLIEKSAISPMLAKKFEGVVRDSKTGYYITEKLDGNRCIAWHDGIQWHFSSRNGKEMYVDFDMTGLPTKFIYDGEVLAKGALDFNSTSGIINTHSKDKQLMYYIFDIIGDAPYCERRSILNALQFNNNDDVMVLPCLAYCKTINELNNKATELLETVTGLGGEGIMINLGDGRYVNKRTDLLLKLKKVYTMDMKVVDFEWGTGKYEDAVGALYCKAEFEGKKVYCWVGTGLSDEQRFDWALNQDKIVGKIVEVSYFSLSQGAGNKGSELYSLRFPRLKQVRYDKNDSSIY